MKIGSVITLYTPSNNVLEPYYLCNVLEINVAENVVNDVDGHCALPGEKYLKCQYLENVKQVKKGFQYKLKETKSVIVHPMQILCHSVTIDDNLFLSMEENLFLSSRL